MSGVAIRPFKRFGNTIVVSEIAHQFTCEVLDRGQYSSCDYVALDLGEPVFDLVEPGGVGRSVVQVDLGMGREELPDMFGFMGREIISNDVDLRAAWLIGDQVGQKSHKLLTRVV